MYPRENSPGLTEDTIAIGLPGRSVRVSDTWQIGSFVQQSLQKLVEQKNAHGGIGGRTITPGWTYNALSGTAEDTLGRNTETCDLTVREQPTFAFTQTVVSDVTDLRRAGCLGSERVINILVDKLIGADDLAGTPDVVAPYALDDVTAGRVLVRRLKEQGFSRTRSACGPQPEWKVCSGS